MSYLISQFVDRLNSFSAMNSELSDMIQKVAKVDYYKKGEHLLKESEVCDKAGLLVKGLVRFYYINEEKAAALGAFDPAQVHGPGEDLGAGEHAGGVAGLRLPAQFDALAPGFEAGEQRNEVAGAFVGPFPDTADVAHHNDAHGGV